MIIAKSALIKSQMDCKMNLGADALEIQLLSELIDNDNIASAFPNLGECLNMPVYSIHTPLVQYTNSASRLDILIEVLVRSNYINLFENICKLANKFGVVQNKVVWIVVHSSLTSSCLETADKDLIESIIESLIILLEKYKNIGIALENVTPVKYFNKGEFEVCNNFLYDNVEIIKYLRKRMPKFANRLVTVLDTCHAEMSIQFIRSMNVLFDNELIDIPRLQDYFEANKDVLKFIHLSRTVLNGNGIGRHGQPFTESTRDYIHDVLDYMHKCKEDDCDIVLEVAETDYNRSLGFDISNKLLREELDFFKE